MYEMMLYILGEKGAVPIPALCHEITQVPFYRKQEGKTVNPATIRSIVERKKDLFTLKDGLVAIHPDKQLTSLVANVGDSYGPWYKIEVNFNNKMFHFFEWHIGRSQDSSPSFAYHGNVNIFKREIYRLKIWDWKQDYQVDGIILDGTSWSVTLKTATKTYKSRGFQSFPSNWNRFCVTVQSLTGKPFS